MKQFIPLAALMLAVALPHAQAQEGPDDQYVIIYSLMNQADSVRASGDAARALSDYAEAQAELQKFQKTFPDWHTNVVGFRLNYLAQQIAAVTPLLPVAHAPPPTANTNAPVPAAQVESLEAQLSALHQRVQVLEADNATLQAKLKEALAVQPASVDPRELAQARGQINSLTKENDLLKVGLAQALAAATNAAPPAAGRLAEAERQLKAATARADKLARLNRSLQDKLQTSQADAAAAAALRDENEVLKKQLADLKSGASASFGADDAKQALAQARERIASQRHQADMSALEKTALENRVRQLESAAKARVANAPSSGDDAKLKQEVETLRARVAADEAKPVPYTSEELALLRTSAPPLQAPNRLEAPVPAGDSFDPGTLAAEAQGYFSARQFDKARSVCLEILRRDPKNARVLANLATIEIELNQLPDAERHIRAALAQRPDDAGDLAVLGHLQILQENYDGAVSTLSRAAGLNPKSAEIENYLGVALAQKGLRRQAETALRKSVLLDSSYGDAHNNLAMIYLSDDPPEPMLARWEYRKALAAGRPRNPGLEKMLAEKGAPVNE
ncbi:MAG: tetratricopeptide repeat protein [Verrucomicrobiota bacterium]|nr:tetratricopeptide repeat protein [Verrucomicrobiota bacterium]